MEDYLECILLLEREKRVARVSDISGKMNVRKASVVSAVAFLQENALLMHERYGYITLTEKGREMAAAILKKHNALYSFLARVLKIGDELAEKEASAACHVLSGPTIEKITAFARAAAKQQEKPAKKPAKKKR